MKTFFSSIVKIFLISLLFIVLVSSSEGVTIERLSNVPITNDFLLSPAKVDISIKPGNTNETTLLVSNRMGRTQTFEVSVEDIQGTKNAEPAILLGKDRGPYSLKDFISVDAESILLRHGERGRIPIRITVPKDATPGGRYGSVIISVRNQSLNDVGSGAIINTRLAALFLVRVEGNVEEMGVLKIFDMVHQDRFFWKKEPVYFQITFENTGMVHVNPYGYIDIVNIFGKKVEMLEVEPWFILPSATRTRVMTTVRSYGFGRYKTTLFQNRGYGDIVDERTVYFWVLPKFIIVLFLLAIFVLLILLTKRRLRRDSS